MFTVGAIIGTHGLKGDVRVFSRTDFPDLRFAKDSRLLLACPDREGFTFLQIESARPHGRVYIVHFEGYETIEQVNSWRGCELKVRADQLPQLPDGEYFVHELLGCEVKTDDGERLGILTEVLSPGANDVYVVRTDAGKSVLLPAIADCILDVNVEKKSITARILPGLLD